MSFDPRHVTGFLPIGKRILVVRYNNHAAPLSLIVLKTIHDTLQKYNMLVASSNLDLSFSSSFRTATAIRKILVFFLRSNKVKQNRKDSCLTFVAIIEAYSPFSDIVHSETSGRIPY